MKNYSLITIAFISMFIIALKAQETTIKLPTEDATSSFQVTDNDDLVRMQADGDGGLLIKGEYGSGTIPLEGAGTRMMFYPAKAAFRAGNINGTHWDDTNIGDYSTAIGRNSQADNSNSTAIGAYNTASGIGSMALGYNTSAGGDYSVAIGYRAITSEEFSIAMGANTNARGYVSTALGNNTIADGRYSTAMGASTTANGNISLTMGFETTAQAYASVVLGRFNSLSGSTDSWVDSDPLVVCGNGSSIVSRSNALVLYKNGNMTIAGTLTESSDRRLKENIEPIGKVLPSLEKINSVYYEFKDKQTHPAGKHIGLIAQEVQEVFPELVTEDSEGILSVEYSKFTAVLLQAVKEHNVELGILNSELKEKNKKTETEIAVLKKENEELKSRLDKLERFIAETAGTGKETRIAQNK